MRSIAMRKAGLVCVHACMHVYVIIPMMSSSGTVPSNKLRMEGLSSYSLSPSAPYKIAVYVPGSKVRVFMLWYQACVHSATALMMVDGISDYLCDINPWNHKSLPLETSERVPYTSLLLLQGAPSFVRMYQYPKLEGAGSIVASRSFYRADNVKFSWNKKGMTV